MGMTAFARNAGSLTGAAVSAALLIVLAPHAGAAQSFAELLARGRALNDSGKAGEAEKVLERALKLNANSAAAHFELGRAVGDQAERASVLKQPFMAKRIKSEFEKAVALDPSLVDAREGLLQFYLRAPGVMGGSKEKAREQAAAVAALSPYRGHYARARIAIDAKDNAAVEREYRGAVAAYPDSLNAVATLVSWLSNNGRAAEGFAPLDQFLAAHPGDRAAQFWIGRTAAISGQQLERGEQLLRGLLASPADATPRGPRLLAENIHFRLGDIAAKRGEKQQARAEYEAALKLNPKHEPAKKALGALK
ncbi:MAG: tetratricopeptide repeat protein [Gemmatimonadetes bacterium]|nr:tetratricopeptide repeat protein [Gemmatimonadota bacterium]